jgi:hypothetical protein
MKRILSLSALALLLSAAGAAAMPQVTHACPIYHCEVNGG